MPGGGGRGWFRRRAGLPEGIFLGRGRNRLRRPRGVVVDGGGCCCWGRGIGSGGVGGLACRLLSRGRW